MLLLIISCRKAPIGKGAPIDETFKGVWGDERILESYENGSLRAAMPMGIVPSFVPPEPGVLISDPRISRERVLGDAGVGPILDIAGVTKQDESAYLIVAGTEGAIAYGGEGQIFQKVSFRIKAADPRYPRSVSIWDVDGDSNLDYIIHDFGDALYVIESGGATQLIDSSGEPISVVPTNGQDRDRVYLYVLYPNGIVRVMPYPQQNGFEARHENLLALAPDSVTPQTPTVFANTGADTLNRLSPHGLVAITKTGWPRFINFQVLSNALGETGWALMTLSHDYLFLRNKNSEIIAITKLPGLGEHAASPFEVASLKVDSLSGSVLCIIINNAVVDRSLFYILNSAGKVSHVEILKTATSALVMRRTNNGNIEVFVGNGRSLYRYELEFN